LCDSDGHLKITGRVDDVMNVSGHRIGTAEVEDALGEHVDVAESAVVSFPHETLGEGIFAFVVLKNESKLAEIDLIRELKNLVKTKISSFAVPQHILVKYVFILNSYYNLINIM
jgi:acetyl-CoA synthetase